MAEAPSPGAEYTLTGNYRQSILLGNDACRCMYFPAPLSGQGIAGGIGMIGVLMYDSCWLLHLKTNAVLPGRVVFWVKGIPQSVNVLPVNTQCRPGLRYRACQSGYPG